MGMTQRRGWLAGWAALAWVVSVGAQQPTEPVRELTGEAARFFAQQRGLPTTSRNEAGGLVELLSVQDDFPIYVTQCNRESAQMMGTYDVGQSPTANPYGHSLRGSGILLGIWDGGVVYDEHPLINELNVRFADSYQYYDEHATHVAGTMIGRASVYAPAGGMADNAELWSYQWDNDTQEMRSAADDGMAVSNHSYGEIRGWYYDSYYGAWFWYGDIRVNLHEDYRFGFYSSRSRSWDQVLYDNPYYLAVVAAGNTRNEAGPADGYHYYIHPDTGFLVYTNEPRNPDGNGTGYDTLSGHGCAKNGITVGAIFGQSASAPFGMSEFSSWGPTDDGRIKPDICAKGVDVLSSTFTYHYDEEDNLVMDPVYEAWNGTSMASPGIAGSLGLVYEFWNDILGGDAKPLSATVRALVAHTADDLPPGAGDGPDYRYGWGLLDMIEITETMEIALGEEGAERTAAIFEETLAENSEDYYVVNVPSGESLKATLAWTDPPASVQSRQLNPRKSMLVNDLDLEVVRVRDGVTFYPYRLDVTQKSAVAKTDAPNTIDNIERIDAPTSAASEVFEIFVHHTGSLKNDRQNYSLVITGGVVSGTDGSPILVDRPSSIDEGSTATFGVKLPAKPVGSVTVSIQNLSASGPFSVLPGYDTLLFDGNNWNVPQSVTIQAAQDSPENGCVETAVFQVMRSDLPEAVTLLPIRSTDEDLEVVPEKTGIAMTEGVPQSIGIRLSDTPCIPVRAYINQVSGSSTVSVSPNVLVFDDSNYNVEQALEITAAIDAGDYQDEVAQFEIVLEGRSQVVPLNINVADADALELTLGSTSLSVDEGTRELRELGSSTAGRRVPVALNLPPASDDTLTVKLERTLDSDPDIYLWDRDRDLAVTSLSFVVNAANWQTMRDLLFVAAEDSDSVDGEAFFRVSYLGLPNPNRYGQVITMSERDENVLRPVVQNVSGEAYRQSVFPNMTPGLFTLYVRLNVDPGRQVTVTATPLNGTTAFQILNDPAEFVFDSSNWDVPQELRIQVIVDADDVQDNLRLEISGDDMPELTLELQELERLSYNSPAAPALKEPPNNSLVTTDSITLKWSDIELAETYDVYVSNTPVPVGEAATKFTVKQPSLELSGLEKGLTYYWRVIVNNPAGSTPSSIFRFATPSLNNQDTDTPDDNTGGDNTGGGDSSGQDQPSGQDDPNDATSGDSQQTTTSSSGGICGVPTLMVLLVGLLATYPRRRKA